jgi:hypothetical protein
MVVREEDWPAFMLEAAGMFQMVLEREMAIIGEMVSEEAKQGALGMSLELTRARHELMAGWLINHDLIQKALILQQQASGLLLPKKPDLLIPRKKGRANGQ